MSTLEFGLDTFLPVTVDRSGRPIRGDQVIRNAVEEAVLAEAAGIDSFNIGEHYRTEFMDSAAHVVLAAIASALSAWRFRGRASELLPSTVFALLLFFFFNKYAFANYYFLTIGLSALVAAVPDYLRASVSSI